MAARYEIKTASGERLATLPDSPPQSFVDMWNERCGSYGKYDPANAPDPEHPFYLNELWLTYKEAIIVDLESGGGRQYYQWGAWMQCKARTFYPIRTMAGAHSSPTGIDYQFENCKNLEVLVFETQPHNVVSTYTFHYCTKLRKVQGGIRTVGTAFEPFAQSPELEYVRFYNQKAGVSFAKNPRIDFDSFRYLVDNATNTELITITVHPDVYAKLTDTSNTEWNKVLLDAQAKQIAFAAA